MRQREGKENKSKQKAQNREWRSQRDADVSRSGTEKYGDRRGQTTPLSNFSGLPPHSSPSSVWTSSWVCFVACPSYFAMLAFRSSCSRHFRRTATLRASTGGLRSTRQNHSFAQSRFFQVSEEVRDAVATGKPVVALESTIYTHGTVDNVSLLAKLTDRCRLPVSRQRSPGYAARNCRSCQWRCSCHYWYFKWRSSSWSPRR
jgi:hypothetical protein